MRMVAGRSKYDDDDDDDDGVYKTVVLNIDERFLFERKQTPVENTLFILYYHTIPRLPQSVCYSTYTARE